MIRTIIRTDEPPEIRPRIDEVSMEFPGIAIIMSRETFKKLRKAINEAVTSDVKLPKSPGVPQPETKEGGK